MYLKNPFPTLEVTVQLEPLKLDFELFGQKVRDTRMALKEEEHETSFRLDYLLRRRL